MKKILLSLMLIGSFAFSKAQVVLNEIYTDPGSGNSEFIELYNNGISNVPVDLDCYSLVVMYATGSGQLNNLTRGFYVLDFPAVSINSKEFLVGAAADPFNVQAKTNVDAAFSWNSLAATGSLQKFQYNGSGFTDITNTIPANFNNLFAGMPSAMGVTFAVFLYNGSTLINGLIGGGGVSSSAVPTTITGLPAKSVSTSCGSLAINFSQITQVEFSNSNPGNDNGYARLRDGNCGSWDKTSNNHTPNASNGATGALDGSLVTSNFIVCPGVPGQDAVVHVNVTGTTGNATAANTLDVDVQLYYDNTSLGTLGKLDGNDTYVSDVVYHTFTDGEKTFNIPYADKNKPILLAYKTVLGCYDKIVSLAGDCIPLPVKFKSFNASRTTTSNVSITWTTASEQNSKGFNVQKNVGGEWKTIAFVPSQALGGNSSYDINYSFKDANNEKGITQYRVQQVDLDGKFAYTDIRAIRGEGTVGKIIVYPNPSVDGKVNVVFEDNTVRDIQVNDMQGKIIKSYRGITNNTLVIERLTSGFYTIKITNRNTAASSVEKVVVK
jgi:hypothetical protein